MSGPMRGDEGGYGHVGYGDDVPGGYEKWRDVFSHTNDEMKPYHGGGLPPEIEINAKPAREAGPVLRHINTLDNELDRLDNAISNLIDKVVPVLNPNATGESGEDVTEKSQSDLAHLLEEKCERVYRLTAIVNDVARRIEL